MLVIHIVIMLQMVVFGLKSMVFILTLVYVMQIIMLTLEIANKKYENKGKK